MLKGALRVLLAGLLGFLTIVAVYVVLAVQEWPAVMSNGRLIALLAAPIAIGLVVGVVVYRLLEA